MSIKQSSIIMMTSSFLMCCLQNACCVDCHNSTTSNRVLVNIISIIRLICKNNSKPRDRGTHAVFCTGKRQPCLFTHARHGRIIFRALNAINMNRILTCVHPVHVIAPTTHAICQNTTTHEKAALAYTRLIERTQFLYQEFYSTSAFKN